MSDKPKPTDVNLDWLAIAKGDKEKAREMLQRLAGLILCGHELPREDRFRLADALREYDGDPAAFFGYGRPGPSAQKSKEKFEVWEKVREHKHALKEAGKKQVDAYFDVGEELEMEERTVRQHYEEIQRYVKQFEQDREVRKTGIASLIP